jgi:acyl-CoA synthetase (AMP-forming)/AMP-acid ligase II
MALYLIRPAQAGRRDSWHGPDDLRPLNALGRAQATGIAAWLGDVPVAQILSSPLVRCVETVRPFAAQRGLAVQVTDVLSPSGALESADVAEAAVIGVPDERWGETIKAIVVLAAGAAATERELIEHCRAHLAHYKCPTSIELVDTLARTATGKVQKFKLRAPYWEGRVRLVN